MRSAFTIIEVIVTFVIMSILIFFAIYSFRFSITNINHAVYYLPKKAMAFSTLDNTLGGIYFYVIETRPKHFSDYFYGDHSKIDFTTSSGVFSDDLSIATLTCKENKMLYREDKLFSKDMDITNPKMTKNSKTIILFENISSCEFKYITAQGDINSTVKAYIPSGIDLKFVQNKQKYHLIFSIGSDYRSNKVYMFNEKYPM